MRFLRIEEQKRRWYGGAQEWCEQKYMKQYGCGVIGCANVLLHIYQHMSDTVQEDGAGRKHLKWKNSFCMDKDSYMEFVEHLRKYYLPVFPVIGMNGIVMMFGMNRYFHKHQLPYKARWGCLPWNIWKRTKLMLEAQIPVVLAIGPNFPILWGNHRLTLYEKDGMLYHPKTTTKAHYVTITEMDGEWLTISSWGKKYYIKKAEYEMYVRKHSNYLFSNILVIQGRKKHNILCQCHKK